MRYIWHIGRKRIGTGKSMLDVILELLSAGLCRNIVQASRGTDGTQSRTKAEQWLMLTLHLLSTKHPQHLHLRSSHGKRRCDGQLCLSSQGNSSVLPQTVPSAITEAMLGGDRAQKSYSSCYFLSCHCIYLYLILQF